MSLTGNAVSGYVLRGKLSGLKTIHGHSAYEVAVINGFSGTEEEWLASLKGDPGYTPQKGVDYFDGEDGYTPQKGVDYFDGYTPQKGVDYDDGEKGDPFTYEDFTEEQLADLKGEPGYTPQKNVDYFDGEDGYSPTVSVEEITGGNRVSLTDQSGTKTVDIMNGKDGEDGKDGVTRWWKVDEPESNLAGEVVSLDYFGEDVTIDVFHVWDIVVANDGAIMPVEAIYTKDTLGYDAVALGLSIGKFSGDSVDAMAGEPLAEGDNLNNTKFTSFTGNMKIFYTPSAVGDIQNTPEGLEASGVYFPMVLCLKGAATHCVQYLIANNEIVSAANFNGATLYDKQVWMRNLDAFYWTPWTKVFPVSGGVTSWNDLTDRPFYEEGGLVEVLPETTANYNLGNQTFVPGYVDISIGETCMVMWEGAKYECVAFAFEGSEGSPAVGNTLIMGGEDNGMPFLLVFFPDEVMVIATVSGTYTFSIEKVSTTIKTIDPKFLPEALQFGEEEGLVEVYPETTVAVTNNQAILDKNIKLEVGKTYFVTWDGTEYECVAENVSFEGAPGIAVGNPYFTGGSNNDMPFAIGHSDYAGISLAVAMTDGDHTFSVKCAGIIIKTIDKKYLPPDIGNGSSGGGSNIIADEVLPETTATCTAPGFGGPASLPPFLVVPGKTYLVTYDGTEYECVAQQPTVSGYTAYACIGSIPDLDIAGNGEPFGLITTGGVVAMLIGETGTHTLRVVEAPVQKPREIVVDLTSASSSDSESEIALPENAGAAEQRYVTSSGIVAPDLYNLLWAKKHDIPVKILFNLAGNVAGLSGGTTQVIEGEYPHMRCSFLYSFAPSVGGAEFYTYVINVEIPMGNLSAYVYISKLH